MTRHLWESRRPTPDTGAQFATRIGRLSCSGYEHGKGVGSISFRFASSTANFVIQIGTENGKKIKNTAGVYYNDEYVRRGDIWLSAKRVSHFTWRDREEMAHPPR